MHIEIVPNHHITLSKCGSQLCGHISIKDLTIDGAFYHPWCHQFVAAKCGNESLGVPLAEWSISDKPLALFAATSDRCHVGFDAGFINEQYPPRTGLNGRKTVLVPFFALSPDIGACALRCQQSFFYS